MSKLALIEVQCVKEGKCWIWKGSKDDRGRPQMHFNGKTMYVRRVARICGRPRSSLAGTSLASAGRQTACRRIARLSQLRRSAPNWLPSADRSIDLTRSERPF